METLTCKSCSAPLEFNEGTEVAVCPYCNTKHRIPKQPPPPPQTVIIHQHGPVQTGSIQTGPSEQEQARRDKAYAHSAFIRRDKDAKDQKEIERLAAKNDWSYFWLNFLFNTLLLIAFWVFGIAFAFGWKYALFLIPIVFGAGYVMLLRAKHPAMEKSRSELARRVEVAKAEWDKAEEKYQRLSGG